MAQRWPWTSCIQTASVQGSRLSLVSRFIFFSFVVCIFSSQPGSDSDLSGTYCAVEMCFDWCINWSFYLLIDHVICWCISWLNDWFKMFMVSCDSLGVSHLISRIALYSDPMAELLSITCLMGYAVLLATWHRWTCFLRAKAECFARLCHRMGVRPSGCPSVRHTRELYQNGAS